MNGASEPRGKRNVSMELQLDQFMHRYSAVSVCNTRNAQCFASSSLQILLVDTKIVGTTQIASIGAALDFEGEKSNDKGNWNAAVATWRLDYLVSSFLSALMWILIIFGIPAIAIGLIWWMANK